MPEHERYLDDRRVAQNETSCVAVRWETSADGRFLRFISPGAKDLLGYPVSRWHRKNFWIDCVHPEDRRTLMEEIATNRDRKPPYDLSYRMVRADGSVLWVRDHVLFKDTSVIRGVTYPVSPTEERQLDESKLNRQLKHLLKYRFEIREDEARRLGAEIHDDLGQLLTVATRNVELAGRDLEKEGHRDGKLAARLQWIEADLRAVLNRLRMHVSSLHPPCLEQDGLASALRFHVDRVANSTGIRFVVDIEEAVLPEPDAEIHLFRIAQEAISNASRHSNASEIRLTLCRRRDSGVLEVTDNGKGFTLTQSYRGGIGLRTSRDRAQVIGGELSVRSEPLKGTRLSATFPLRHESDTPLPAIPFCQ